MKLSKPDRKFRPPSPSQAVPARTRASPRSSRPLAWRWRVSLVAIGLIILALLGVVFGSEIAKAVVKAFGVGLVLVLLLVVFGGLTFWRLYLNIRQAYERLVNWLKAWNHPLGLVCFLLAALGVMAFIAPTGLTVMGISLADVSAGGNLGRAIIGSRNWLGAVRVMALVAAGSFLVSPRGSWGLVNGGWRRRPAIPVPAPPPLFRRKKKIQAPPPVAPPPAPEPRMTSTLPPITLLEKGSEVKASPSDNQERAQRIEQALASYGVEATVSGINPGPTVTQFAVDPGWDRKFRTVMEKDPWGRVRLDRSGNPKSRQEEVSRMRVKVERITALSNNLALALAAPSIRVEAPIPGKPVVGLEVPNPVPTTVTLRSVLESPAFQRAKAKANLALGVGKGMGGEAEVADLTRMPHLLIAGQTGSGKTVCLHSFVVSLLMQHTPKELRLLLIDPKRVEMVVFNGVPHLVAAAVVEVPAAVDALRRVMLQMETRFKLFAEAGARNLEAYNRNPLGGQALPYLVVVIDELADLMMASGNVVEASICRLAQLARATGIHLVVATQRPSVDVVTGLIKANFPARISFAVASQVDSRTILDTVGSEKLLGRGDMLFLPPDAEKPRRLQGCLLTDEEIQRVVTFWQRKGKMSPDELALEFQNLGEEEGGDPLLDRARELAAGSHRVSTSMLQRHLRIGYPRAARIMDLLEAEGSVETDGDEGKG